MNLNIKPVQKIDTILAWIIPLGLISLLLENSSVAVNPIINILCHILDDSIVVLFGLDIITNFLRSRYKMLFVQRNYLDIIFLVAVVLFFIYLIYNKYYNLSLGQYPIPFLISKIVLFISIFNLLRQANRLKKANYFFEFFTSHPAQTITLCFIFVIFTGTVLLMLPFSTPDYSRIGFVNALFTATSATCITGLTVVDTASKFSLFGQIIILCLIQIGGLGIMLFSFFSAFFLKKGMSFSERMTLSYALNENDIKNVAEVVKKIIRLTLTLELAGAILLFIGFKSSLGINTKNIFFSVFHAISAFCNAGFSLFTDNLESYKSNSLIIITLASLIILGGISFLVIKNITEYFGSHIKIHGRRKQLTKISLNTKIVLIITLILIISGTLLIYHFEHKKNLINYDIKTQYLSAFFQSVTLRTAGFNSLNISDLRLPTYLIMILFMFIGGAAGSTAGGVKVNTVGIVYAYLKTLISGNKNEVVLSKQAIPKKTVGNAFALIILSSILVFIGTFILSITENTDLMKIIFEVVSAFGTVGLSTGITPTLTLLGKIIISSIMFVGRVGPLTLITAVSYRKKILPTRYPEEDVFIG